MVAVALEVVEEQVGGDVVAVPAVPRRHPLVPSARLTPADQPVVLEVVDHLEEGEAEHRLHREEGDDPRAEAGDQRGEEDRAQRPGVEHVVAQRPGPAATALQAGALDLPGGAQAPDHGAGQELPEGLAEARARRVLGGGDADVVAAVVLGVEVAVSGLGERDLREPALDEVLLVAELVGGVDGDAAGDADGDREPEGAEGREAAVAPLPAGPDEGEVLEGEVRVRAPAVPAVGLEVGQGGLGRVGGVAADEGVEQRDEPVHEDRPQPPEHPEPGEGCQAPRHDGEQGHEQAERPQVPLAVPPAALVGRHRALRPDRHHRRHRRSSGSRP